MSHFTARSANSFCDSMISVNSGLSADFFADDLVEDLELLLQDRRPASCRT